MAARIVVVGSANVDLFCRVPRLPGPGETVTHGTFDQAPGGKGANQAVAAARLGAEVTFLARLGNDDHGRAAIAGYRRDGLNTDLITMDQEAATGVALILVEQGGENLIAVAPGANQRWRPEHLNPATWPAADILLLQLEIPLPTVVAAARLAREAGARVILNPAPLPADGLPVELLASVDGLVVNAVEAAQLGGPETLPTLGPAWAILTRGAAGAVVLAEGRAEVVPAPLVEAVDAVGAGDAFCGALAVSLAEGRPLAAATRWACCAGALAATRPGAQPSLPSRAAVEQLHDA